MSYEIGRNCANGWVCTHLQNELLAKKVNRAFKTSLTFALLIPSSILIFQGTFLVAQCLVFGGNLGTEKEAVAVLGYALSKSRALIIAQTSKYKL